MFIRRLDIISDVSLVNGDLATILTEANFEYCEQIGLKNISGPLNDKWYDSCGSLYTKSNGRKMLSERDYTEWNITADLYVRQQIELLEQTLNIKTGRVRFMRLLPKTGLSVHRDAELRYHLVLKTNPNAYIAHATGDINPLHSDLPTTAACYHIPQDGHWYEIDTRETHWVYNGGWEERIHLVVCGI
jgi:hypothetical protein